MCWKFNLSQDRFSFIIRLMYKINFYNLSEFKLIFLLGKKKTSIDLDFIDFKLKPIRNSFSHITEQMDTGWMKVVVNRQWCWFILTSSYNIK